MDKVTPDDKTLQTALSEINSEKTYLICQKHFYTPSKFSKPVSGCQDCWRALYWTLYARTPDEDKQDFVEGLEMTIRHMVEHEAKGTWDYKPLDTLDVKIESTND